MTSNHSIKINRSHALAPHVPSAQRELDGSISPMLLDRLTAAELAEVRRCLNNHWHKAIAATERGIVGEGCVWDERNQCLREIGPVTVTAEPMLRLTLHEGGTLDGKLFRDHAAAYDAIRAAGIGHYTLAQQGGRRVMRAVKVGLDQRADVEAGILTEVTHA